MIIFRIFNGFTFMYFHIVKIQGELFNLHTGAKNHNESKNSHVENRIFQEIHILKIILFHIIHIFSKNSNFHKIHKIQIFHKFTLFSQDSHVSQDSQNLHFQPIQIFTKFTFSTYFTFIHISNSSEFMDKKCDFAPV